VTTPKKQRLKQPAAKDGAPSFGEVILDESFDQESAQREFVRFRWRERADA
jgi:hypothetical protein